MSPIIKVLNFRIITIILVCCYHFVCFGQDTTLQNRNKEAIIKYLDAVINTHNLDLKVEFFATDYIWHTMDGKDVHSNLDSGHTAILRWLFSAIPDVHYNIDNIVAGGDMVGVNTTVTGTARSEMFGLPIAKKKVRYNQMFFYRLKDGKITDQWEVIDPAAIKTQLEKK